MNSTISLTYLPKKYKAYPFTHNERVIRGRLTNIDTFGRICPNRKVNKLCMDLAIKIEQLENLDTILDTLSDFISSL
jgi:hypothetical protein